MSKKPAKSAGYPEFLKELLEAKSPTGLVVAANDYTGDGGAGFNYTTTGGPR